MDYCVNVATPVSFDDYDIFQYLDTNKLPEEPTDEEALDDEAVEISVDFIKWLLKDESFEIDSEATEDSKAFEELSTNIENYIHLKRHMPKLYERLER